MPCASPFHPPHWLATPALQGGGVLSAEKNIHVSSGASVRLHDATGSALQARNILIDGILEVDKAVDKRGGSMFAKGVQQTRTNIETNTKQ